MNRPTGLLARALSALLPGTRSSETIALIVTAITVGVLTGLAAVGFDLLVRATGKALVALPSLLGALPGAIATVLVPTLGGLLVAPIVVRWAPDARGSGIPGVMYAVSNLGGRVPRVLALWRPLATTLSIGSGASLGSEGPVVQMGASLASTLAGPLGLNAERRRTLVAVAAAGGIAATFNVPIAGVLFAVEVILGEFRARDFSSIVIGAVSATAVSRSILGDVPAFAVPNFHLGSAVELPLYLALGVLCAAAAVGFKQVLMVSENVFDALRLPPMLRPAAGGLVVGVIAVAFPEVLGRGYDEIGRVLQGSAGPALLLLGLAFAKTAATGASFGSWGSGGAFAPVLFVGSALGSAFGQASEHVFPALVHHYGAFALVGMAGVLSGVTRAPMSSIVMVFEMSGSYALILPLLLAAVISTLTADLFRQESLYERILSRHGRSLFRLREIDLLQTVEVKEVMDRDVPALYQDQTLAELAERTARSHHHGFVLRSREDPEHITGIVTLTDLERARQQGRPSDTAVIQLGQRDVATSLPNESASAVLERMAELGIGRMPVVDRRDTRRPIGMVRQADLARAYYLALERERLHEETREALRLRDVTGQEIVEVRIPKGSSLEGRRLRDAGLPEASIVVAVRRRGRTLFPHGDTTLEAGDMVVASVAHGHVRGFREAFQKPPSPGREER
ncbi:MAG: chloride channel protein [Deinococcales bacterium]